MNKDYLKQYCQYIINTGQRPLAIAAFDDDWEPIGPIVRADLMNANFIEEHAGAIILTNEGEEFVK